MNAQKTHLAMLAEAIVAEMVQEDPREFDPAEAPERYKWAVEVVTRGMEKWGAGGYMAVARERPDFAGGTVFSSEDVAMALHGKRDADIMDGVDPVLVALVTPGELNLASDVLEKWLMERTDSTWVDALREAFGVTFPEDDDDGN